MSKMHKRIVSLIIVFSMLLVTNVSVFAKEAIESVNVDVRLNILGKSDKEAILSAINSIPTFLVITQSGDEMTKKAATETISKELTARKAGANEAPFKSFTAKTSNCSIIEQSATGKEQLLSFFPKSFGYVKEMIEQGTVPEYIIVHMKADPFDNTRNSNLGPDDISFWETYFPVLGTYDGYKFLYGEVQSYVVTDEIDASNIRTSVNWRTLLASGVQTFFAGMIDDMSEDFATAIEWFSVIFGSIEPAISVTYGQSGGHIKTQVAGDIYVREVYIRDDDDRVDGYAYYSCAFTQWFNYDHYIETRYPVERLPSGLYRYATETECHENQVMSTPGCFGGSDFYETLIDYYNNSTGYFTYYESFDVSDAIAEIVYN